ncbi:MAG: hemolysin family protein [Oscillospiraceae bacterium]|jgi:putative hemolysin|nr:hemolysin family protein [Oscillospiraceae bacterium]
MPPEPDGSHLPALLTLSGAGSAPHMHPAASILLLAVLILINAFFSSSEIAVVTLKEARIEKMAENGSKKAQKLLKLTSNSSRFFSTIQIGVTLAGFLSSAAASENFSDSLAAALAGLPFSPPVIKGISTVLITLLLSYFSLIFGELVPKKIAINRAEELSFKFVNILTTAATIFRPVVSFLTVSTNGILRLLGIDPTDTEQPVTEEEIMMMVDAGEEKGVLDEDAKDMISNIFEFSDSTVGDAMTHRTEVAAVEDTESVSAVVALSMEQGYSRIPVFHEDLDNVLGIIYIKDLLKYIGSPVSPEVKLTDVMRPAYFVPESKPCSKLFSEMTARKLQIAVVVDEYGGTSGIITMEDLLESIVGSMQDEYDREDDDIQREGDNRFSVDGATPVDEISDLTGVELPESDDYDTIAGLVIEVLGRIPKKDEHPYVIVKNLKLTVAEMEDRRIARILIEKEPPAPAGAPPDGALKP